MPRERKWPCGHPLSISDNPRRAVEIIGACGEALHNKVAKADDLPDALASASEAAGLTDAEAVALGEVVAHMCLLTLEAIKEANEMATTIGAVLEVIERAPDNPRKN